MYKIKIIRKIKIFRTKKDKSKKINQQIIKVNLLFIIILKLVKSMYVNKCGTCFTFI